MPSSPKSSAARAGAIAGSRPLAVTQAREAAPLAGAALSTGWAAASRSTSRLGSPETTAQVHPAAFTQAMMHAAEARGAKLRIGTVTGVLRDTDGERVRGVLVDGAAGRGRCSRHRHGALVDLCLSVAAAPKDLWAEGPQHGVRDGHGGASGVALPRIPGGGRHGDHAGNFSARRRHDLCLRASPAKARCRKTPPTSRPIPAR